MRVVTGSTTLLPLQTALPYYGKEISVEGLRDRQDDQIEYLGKAHHVFDNVYRCLAVVHGSLCVVEISAHPIKS